jgi:hypothetical protein
MAIAGVQKDDKIVLLLPKPPRPTGNSRSSRNHMPQPCAAKPSARYSVEPQVHKGTTIEVDSFLKIKMIGGLHF